MFINDNIAGRIAFHPVFFHQHNEKHHYFVNVQIDYMEPFKCEENIFL